MHIDRIVLITLSVALLVLNFHNAAELEDHHNLENGIVDAKIVDKAGDGIVEKVHNNNSVDSKNKDNKVLFGFNETSDNITETNGTNKAGDDSTEKTEEGVIGKLEKGTVEPERKVGLRGEECGSSSNSCVIEDKANLVACLRVPGNESPDLSLLIQNQGKEPATVTIFAPEFVHVETNEIEVPKNENKKMKVSIRNRGMDTVMVLKSGNGNCSLDFKDLLSQETLQNHLPTSRFAVVLVSNVLYLILAGFLVISLFAMFVGLSRKRSLDTEFLPVSNGGVGTCTKRKTIIESKDGWEDNWNDDWDDHDDEAPKTTFNSSFSQDVISSRRISKDGWKD